MNYTFFPKTSDWPPSIDIRKNGQKGAVTILAAFLFVVFSALGMGMFYASRIYLSISAYKRNAIQLEYASESGIKQTFHRLLDRLSLCPNPIHLNEQEMESLKENLFIGGTQALERLIGADISLTHASGWENMKWNGCLDWTIDQIEAKEEHVIGEFLASIVSEGRLEGFKPIKDSRLDLTAKLDLGYFPLARFPVLIDRQLPSDQLADFLEKNPIELVPALGNKLPEKIHFTQETILPQTAEPLLQKALNIQIFEPGSLSAPQLRQALGLDIADEPVPNGVYLIQNDIGLGGVFVQGDCEEMILAIEGDFQVISFAMEGQIWILKFSQVSGQTSFISPQETREYNRVPLGILFVNGSIHSLGGGMVESSGNIALAVDQEVPCVLSGVNLTIVSSDKITLSSHLIQQGVDWSEGIPYVKNPKSMLNLFATGKDLLDGSDKSGQIVIDKDSPQDLKIQASLTASNEGIAIEGENKTVFLLGSLQVADLSANGNRLKIKPDGRFLDLDDLLIHTPRSSQPLLSLFSLKITGWNEN